MQTLVDGAVITQGNLEAVGRLASRPGVIPIPVQDVWLICNPFEPKTATADHNTVTDTWIPRAPGDIYILKNQTILAAPTTIGYGGPLGGVAADPSAVIMRPAVNFVATAFKFIDPLAKTLKTAFTGAADSNVAVGLAVVDVGNAIDTQNSSSTIVITINNGTIDGVAGPVTRIATNGLINVSIKRTTAGVVNVVLSGGNTTLIKTNAATVTFS